MLVFAGNDDMDQENRFTHLSALRLYWRGAIYKYKINVEAFLVSFLTFSMCDCFAWEIASFSAGRFVASYCRCTSTIYATTTKFPQDCIPLYVRWRALSSSFPATNHIGMIKFCFAFVGLLWKGNFMKLTWQMCSYFFLNSGEILKNLICTSLAHKTFFRVRQNRFLIRAGFQNHCYVIDYRNKIFLGMIVKPL